MGLMTGFSAYKTVTETVTLESDDLMKRAKIAAVKRGSSLRDLVAEALSRLLAEQSSAKRKRMTEAPIKLAPGHTIPIRSNSEIAQLFDQDDITHLNDVYRGR